MIEYLLQYFLLMLFIQLQDSQQMELQTKLEKKDERVRELESQIKLKNEMLQNG